VASYKGITERAYRILYFAISMGKLLSLRNPWEKRAQKHVYRLNPQTLSQFETWVQQMQQRWEERFAALDTVLEREKRSS
jgi:hypothetical protein